MEFLVYFSMFFGIALLISVTIVATGLWVVSNWQRWKNNNF